MTSVTEHNLMSEPHSVPSALHNSLSDAVMVFLLLVIFPLGFALLVLGIAFGRSLPRSLAALMAGAALHASIIVEVLVTGSGLF